MHTNLLVRHIIMNKKYFGNNKMKSNKLNSEVYEYINQYTNEIINSKEFRSKYAKELIDKYGIETKYILLDIDFPDDKKKRLAKTFLLSEVLHILKSLLYKKDKYYEF